METRLLAFILCVFVLRVRGSSNGSYEHLVRKELLTDYDKTVLPKLGGGHVTVVFGLKINKLISVNDKEQLLTLDTWIIMKWNNTFLQWDKSKYGGTDVVQFLPSEIWFPDIQLYNNGDTSTPRAGGPEKFLSDVQVHDGGRCVWSGPATFTVNCEMKLNKYPFDHQTCELRFGSYSYAKNKVRMNVFKTKANRGGRFVESGDWDLTDLKSSTGDTDHGNCCPYQFSEIVYTVSMIRRFQYHLFYLVAPCIMLSILALLSFFIPTESGERIGFVTTILLGMMVFLLIVPESLPKSSQSIPIIGVLLQATMMVIAFILVVTIFILKCFFSARKPPACIRNAFTKSGKEVGQSPDTGGLEIVNINLRALAPSQMKDSRPVSREAFLEKEAEDKEVVWQTFSRVCDKIMFGFFLVGTVAMYAVTLTYRD